MIGSSIASSAAGTMPSAMIADTAAEATSIDSKVATAVRTASGARVSFTMTLVTTPRVPSEPTATPARSYPGRSATTLPSVSTSPVPVTTSRPRTWCATFPYLRAWGPPALVAAFPPIEETIWLEGSGAKK